MLGLDELTPGDCATVCKLENEPAMKKRLQDLGLIENTAVECIGISAGREMHAYLIRGAVIAIRSTDAHRVLVLRERMGGALQWD